MNFQTHSCEYILCIYIYIRPSEIRRWKKTSVNFFSPLVKFVLRLLLLNSVILSVSPVWCVTFRRTDFGVIVDVSKINRTKIVTKRSIGLLLIRSILLKIWNSGISNDGWKKHTLNRKSDFCFFYQKKSDNFFFSCYFSDQNDAIGR